MFYNLTNELIQDHQRTLLAEASQARQGDRIARVARLRHRAVAAARRAQRANAHLS